MKKMRLTIVLLIVLTSYGSAFAASKDSIESLRTEHAAIVSSIEEAKAADEKLAGGLIKALIQMRMEILGINAALVQQRIHALRSRAKVTVKVYQTKPDSVRAAQLEREMQTVKEKLVQNETEIAKYRGGLIMVTLMSASATMENTLAMLQNEYLKAKYGIYWLPGNGEAKSGTRKSASKSAPKKTVKVSTGAEAILIPTITNKRLKKANYEDNIWFDIAWDTTNLKAKTRAVKGVLTFSDLFGESNFVIRKTINDPMTPGEPLVETGIGFEYNQFRDSHQWMLSNDLKDMKFSFEVESIIYADGTTEEF